MTTGLGLDRQAPDGLGKISKKAHDRVIDSPTLQAVGACNAAICQRPSIRTINRPRAGPCDWRGCFAGTSPRVGRGRRSRIYLTAERIEVPPARLLSAWKECRRDAPDERRRPRCCTPASRFVCVHAHASFHHESYRGAGTVGCRLFCRLFCHGGRREQGDGLIDRRGGQSSTQGRRVAHAAGTLKSSSSRPRLAASYSGA